MNKSTFSRRDFMKLAMASLGALLASCMPPATPIPTPTFTPPSIKTNTPKPDPMDTPTSAATETLTPTAVPCFRLLAPEDGVTLPAMGKVTFLWEAMEGAGRYKLEIILPAGQAVVFETDGPGRDQYLEAFSMGGVYQWQVTAFDASGTMLCAAGPFTFEKTEYTAPQNNGGGGGDTPTTSSDWSDWSEW